MFNLKTTILYILFIPLCQFMLNLIYVPMFGLTLDEMSEWHQHSAFCLPIITCIMMGVLAVSRLGIYYVSNRTSRFSDVTYMIWVILEVMLINFFVTLFLSLHFRMGYLDMLPTVMLYGILNLIVPYVVIEFFVRNRRKELRIMQDRDEIAGLLRRREKSEDMDSQAMIKFVDEKGQTKFALPKNRIIFIESAGNYVNIVYDNDGRQMRYALRNTLKGIEPICNEFGLERCHRSYFLNLDRVKLLRRDGDGMMAEIDTPGVDPIPITRSYVGEVMRKISVSVE